MQKTLLESEFQVSESIGMCIFVAGFYFYRIRKSFTCSSGITWELACLWDCSCWKGSNALPVPEDVPPGVPRASSAWVSFYTHPPWGPPESHKARDLPVAPGGWSERCLGMCPQFCPCEGNPSLMFLQSLCTHPAQAAHQAVTREKQPPTWTTESQLLLDLPVHVQHHCISALIWSEG